MVISLHVSTVPVSILPQGTMVCKVISKPIPVINIFCSVEMSTLFNAEVAEIPLITTPCPSATVTLPKLPVKASPVISIT